MLLLLPWLLLILAKVEPQFDHEKLKAYQASLQFVTWATDLLSKLEAKAAVREHLGRASTSVLLNTAKGNGKFVIRDRCRFIDFDRFDQQSEFENQRGTGQVLVL